MEDVKVSYLAKDEIACPVCATTFRREELLSGGGRLIAGSMTHELHRLYEPSVKYGDVYPLVYQSTVCPECWYASMEKDFSTIPRSVCEQVSQDRQKRKDEISLIFPDIDFTKNRNLFTGAASQYLTLVCYDYFNHNATPAIKQGMSSLRAAWLFDELNSKHPAENYDQLALWFRKKAYFFYTEALHREQKGLESLGEAKNLGPDTDKNFGYEGVLYLSAYLSFKYGPTENANYRVEYLESSKRVIAKMVGGGKSSKAKPGPLIEYARTIYAEIKKELNSTDLPEDE